MRIDATPEICYDAASPEVVLIITMSNAVQLKQQSSFIVQTSIVFGDVFFVM